MKRVTYFIVLVGILMFLGSMPAWALENPFDPNPKVEPQPGDTETVEVPLITLKNAILIKDIYAESYGYIDFLLEDVIGPQDDQISILTENNYKLEERNSLLWKVVIFEGIAIGIITILVILK